MHAETQALREGGTPARHPCQRRRGLVGRAIGGMLLALVAEQSPPRGVRLAVGLVQAGNPLAGACRGWVVAAGLPTHGWRELLSGAAALGALVWPAAWGLLRDARDRPTRSAAAGRARLVPVLLVGAAFLLGILLQGGYNGLWPLAATAYPGYIRATGVGWAIGIGRGRPSGPCRAVEL